MSSTDTHRASQPTVATHRGRWPLLGTAAGIGAFIGTLVTDLNTGAKTASAAVLDDVSSGKAHAGLIAGYITVILMLVLAASWRRHVEPRALSSTAAHVVPLGLTAAAGALSLGYGWKGALGLYSGGANDGAFDEAGLYVYYVLNDFGSYIGYLGVTVAAGAVAWMALRERLISRWIGVVSVVALLPVLVTVVAISVPGMPGVIGGLWMAVAFTGLAFGKSTINR